MAFVLNFRDGLNSCEEVFSNKLHILVNIFLVSTNRLVLVLNNMIKLIHILSQVVDGSLKSLKRYHELGLDLDSFLVVILIPNILFFVKLLDLLVEISARKFLSILLGVIRLLVSRVSEVCLPLEFFSLLRVSVVLRSSLGLDWDSRSHSSES